MHTLITLLHNYKLLKMIVVGPIHHKRNQTNIYIYISNIKYIFHRNEKYIALLN